ncbi:MAG: DUF3786 domain-containing protein [Actinomycetota bacterium]|nr:DUF3786 domain-containing protein [Actinomycetota bacterium]
MGDGEKRPQDPLAEPSRVIKASDPEKLAENSGLVFRESRFEIPMMKWTIYVSHPELNFEAPDFLDTFVVRALALLYISKAYFQPLANKWVPYRELKDGLFYTKTFSETVEERISSRFGDDVEGLREACMALGGREVDQGDLGMVLKTFPRLPLLVIVWRGDEEFHPNARVLFDASADGYLNAFELRMLGGEVVSRLISVADGRLEIPGEG